MDPHLKIMEGVCPKCDSVEIDLNYGLGGIRRTEEGGFEVECWECGAHYLLGPGTGREIDE